MAIVTVGTVSTAGLLAGDRTKEDRHEHHQARAAEAVGGRRCCMRLAWERQRLNWRSACRFC